jgi:PEGA domain-containing protein
MNEDHDDDAGKVALDRADEVMHVQDQESKDHAGVVPAVTESTAPREPRRVSPGLAKLLFAVAAVGLVLIVVAFFWNAFEGAAEKASHVILSTGVFRREVELLADSKPDGARVIVDGHERGHTPALLTVECDSGRDMVVEMIKEGYAPSRQNVPCNDRPLKVKATLVPK